jgi:DNA-binding NarL/FixJ family response regulator
MRGKTKFLVLDDHPVFRDGLVILIESNKDYRVVAQAGTIAEAMDSLRESRPDIILVDISLPTENGLLFVRSVKKNYPDIPVLIISMHDEIIYAERSLRAGARGYVMKQAASTVMLTAIRTVLEGKVYLSKAMQNRIMENMTAANIDDDTKTMSTLTEREIDILEYIGQGYSVSEIAKLLFLSVKTINSYRDHIKEKLQLVNAAEIRRFAIEWLQTRTY